MSSGPHPRDKAAGLRQLTVKARLQGMSNNTTLARAKVPGQGLGDKLIVFFSRIPVCSAPTHQL